MDDETTPRLVFTRARHGDKIDLNVSHDRAKSIYGCSGRDNTQLEMPGAFWVRVIPALVSLMDEAERAELLKGIAERLGVELAEVKPATFYAPLEWTPAG